MAAGQEGLFRYRMDDDEICAAARLARDCGYGTLVLQAGEDPGLGSQRMAELIRRLKAETGLAITLSLGERSDADLQAWRAAGADRYLLRFETSNPQLYRRIHPNHGSEISNRLALLRRLKAMGYAIGSGFMVGIPGQSRADVAQDLCTLAQLDCDMIGIGPYLAHPATPLGKRAAGNRPERDQCPADLDTVATAVALARLLCPWANIPATTAVATLDPQHGREDMLCRGANVVMPNCTPLAYRELYQIYPDKACQHESAEQCHSCLNARLRAIGRQPGEGPGHAQPRDRYPMPAIPLPGSQPCLL
ncbi:MAG: [FeFe] hydrogenase H-cluster radical SAM maturase HydE [Planctomycetota bacterium]|nr:MAG: [FeFe] hydrogenase H-cluster radical SAM maturase HydE [Planctomycetota bacterium]